MDDDGNNRLSLGEFKKGIKELSLIFTDSEIRQMFNYFDYLDQGEIDFNEFIIALRNPMNENRQSIVRMAFDSLDEDGDGKISPQDITDVCADARLPLKVSTIMLSFLGPDKKGRIGFKAFRKLFAIDQLECFRSRVQNTLDFSDITGRESDLAAARAAINVDHVDLVEAAGSRAKNSWVDVKEKKTNARG